MRQITNTELLLYRVHVAKREFATAQDGFRKIIARLESQPKPTALDKNLLAEAHVHMGDSIIIETNDPFKSESEYRKSKAIFDQGNLPRAGHSIWPPLQLSIVELRRNNPKKAQVYIDECQALVDRLGLAEVIGPALKKQRQQIQAALAAKKNN